MSAPSSLVSYLPPVNNANQIKFNNSGTSVNSTDIQGVILELITDISNLGGGSVNSDSVTNNSTVSGVTVSDALNTLHSASNITFDNSGSGLSSTNVQSGIVEIMGKGYITTNVYSDINLNNNRITGLANPASNQDAVSKIYADGRYIVSISGGAQLSSLDMTGHIITGLANPTNGTDAVSRIYADGRYIMSISGGAQLSSLDMTGNKITSVANPVSNQDAVTKFYVDSATSSLLSSSTASSTYQTKAGMTSYVKADGTTSMTGALDMGTHKISNVVDPTLSQDVSTKAYVDSATSGFLSTSSASSTYQTQSGMASYVKADGTTSMTGALDMGTHKISNVVDPTLSQDVSTKAYVDSATSGFLSTSSASSTYQTQSGMSTYLTASTASSTYQTQSGMSSYIKKDGTVALTGDLDLGTHKILNVVDPVSAQQVATKAYVDTAISGVSSGSGGTTSMSRYNLSVGRASSVGGTFTSLSTNLGGVGNFQWCEAFVNQIGKFTSMLIKFRIRATSGLSPWNGQTGSDYFIIKLNPLFGTGVTGNVFSDYNGNATLYANITPQRGYSGTLMGSGSAISVTYVIDSASSQIALKNNDGNWITMSMLQTSSGDCQAEIRLDYISA